MAKYNLSAPLTAAQVESTLLRDVSPSFVSAVNTTASITLPTTPTVIALPTTTASSGITYDNTTGIITLPWTDTYHLSMWFNCLPSVVNKNINFYAEVNTGAGWVAERFSARSRTLVKSDVEEQLVITVGGYFPAGLQMRFYVWGEATVYLKTVDLPGTPAGTVTVPAARMIWVS